MRFIILYLILINIGFSSDISCGESLKFEYKINNFNIVECNCRCTSKENIFYIEKDKNIVYKIDSISIAFDNKEEMEEIHNKTIKMVFMIRKKNLILDMPEPKEESYN